MTNPSPTPAELIELARTHSAHSHARTNALLEAIAVALTTPAPAVRRRTSRPKAESTHKEP